MSNVIKRLAMVCVLACVGVLASCEFESSGDSGSWNSAFSWVNFSGVYRAPGGGVLVSDFSLDTGGGGTVAGTNFVNVTNEQIGEGTGVNTTFNGILARKPIVAGSLTISAGGIDLVDNGDGTLSGFNSNGTIDYGTGAWAIDLQGAPLGNGTDITASYSYVSSSGGGGSGGGGGGGGQGSSGSAIVTFTVFQTGNKLEILDNNGARYNGQMGNLATTSGINADSPATAVPSIGDSVIAEYTAEGTSAAGKHVMLTGTFQGTVARGSDTGASMFLTNRRMLGTWVESNGVTGDINGQASPIGITIDTTTVAP